MGWSSFTLGDVRLELPRARLTPELAERLRQGRFERAEAAALERHLRPGDRLLELGAGSGYLGVLAGRRLGGEALMLLEADPEMAAVAERNLAANGVTGATVIAAAAGRPGRRRARLRRGAAFWASRIARPGEGRGGGPAVPVMALGELVARHRPSVVLCDIEGGEVDLDWQALDAGVRLVILELHPGLTGLRGVGRVFRALARAGLVYQPEGSRGAVVVMARP